ncbi:MAG: thioredoxin-disulfide reductase [Nitrospinae bacterium]|nr:thioredoxin-disulfide reductase [Nitrospinota bacterium]
MTEANRYELIIIGGGPAGLAAGLYAARARMKTVCLERLTPGGALALTEDVENYPGFRAITGPDLVEKMLEHAKDFGMELSYSDANSIELDGTDRIVHTDEGPFVAKAVLIASGAKINKLGVPGEEEFSGRGVSYCAVCDGAFFRDQDVVVVGGGDAAIDEGLYLTRLVETVTVIHRRDQLRASKILQERAFANEKVSFMWEMVVREIHGNGMVKEILLENVKTAEQSVHPTDGLFVYIGSKPNTDFVKGLVEMDEAGHIITDLHMQTSVPGIYAAGDVRIDSYRQAVTAGGDGCTAALAAEKYIESLH